MDEVQNENNQEQVENKYNKKTNMQDNKFKNYEQRSYDDLESFYDNI